MTRLTTNHKTLTIELVINERRGTVETIERIAKSLNLSIGERPEGDLEYVQLRHITRNQKEPQHAD